MQRFSVGIEDEASNFFIESNKRYFTYNELNEYMNRVRERAKEKNIIINENLNRDLTYEFFNRYNDLFIDTGDGISLLPDVTISTLIHKFRGYLPLQLLLCFIDKKG